MSLTPEGREGMPVVSLGVVAYNEQENLPRIFADLLAQDYPHERIEVLLVDSMSSDGTRASMQAFADEYGAQFMRVAVLENPKKRQAPGWNIVIENAGGDVLIRMDAHGGMPVAFLSSNVACLQGGEMVCGGYFRMVDDANTPVSRLLNAADTAMFGASVSTFKRDVSSRYVKTLGHAAYRREVLASVGGFDERLGRTEDNEFHYRIHKQGYKICYDPAIVSDHHTRSTLSGMLKQKLGNGYWVGRTAYICPGCLSLYHFVPAVFLLGILLTSILATLGIGWPAACMWGAYGLLAAAMSLQAFCQAQKKEAVYLLMPLVILLIHLTYGAGTIGGLLHFKKL